MMKTLRLNLKRDDERYGIFFKTTNNLILCIRAIEELFDLEEAKEITLVLSSRNSTEAYPITLLSEKDKPVIITLSDGVRERTVLTYDADAWIARHHPEIYNIPLYLSTEIPA